ncbi:hypothetical protein IJ425_03900, partial [bacterium]|nr:hypothetical protein [bacterium]
MLTLKKEKEKEIKYEAFNFISKRQEELFNIVNKAIENKIELFSFDVFDTLITRTTVTPSGIFTLMQHELLQNPKYNYIDIDFRTNFYYSRIGAENYLNRTRYTTQRKAHIPQNEIQQEFAIREFYDLLKYHHNISDKATEELIELEIETENKNTLPLKENIEILKYLISKGKKVILISDMYLKESIIRNLLLKHDEIFKNIKIYVSTDYQAKKSSGNLYKVIKDIEKIEYKKWFHIGDNEYSDIKQANQLSIQTHLIENEKLTEFEENIFESHYNDPYYQTTIGNARNIRRFYPDNKKADFATIATIMLFPYVRWLINQSLEKGFKRLYFIARDGYILKEIADIIITQENHDIETHYIYGSRDAWRMPCVESFDDLWFIPTLRKNTASISQAAKLLNMQVEELTQFLPKYYQKKKTVLTQEYYLILFDILASKPEFINYLFKKNKEQSDLLDEYIKQEIDLKDNNFALVDLTGSGITVDLFSKKISKFTNTKINSFSIERQSKHLLKYSNIYSYNLFACPVIGEFLGRAPHGLTLKYKKTDDKITPILGDSEIIDNFEDYIQIIKEFSKLYNKTFMLNS